MLLCRETSQSQGRGKGAEVRQTLLAWHFLVLLLWTASRGRNGNSGNEVETPSRNTTSRGFFNIHWLQACKSKQHFHIFKGKRGFLSLLNQIPLEKLQCLRNTGNTPSSRWVFLSVLFSRNSCIIYSNKCVKCRISKKNVYVNIISLYIKTVPASDSPVDLVSCKGC